MSPIRFGHVFSSEEVALNWNKRVRETHRQLSAAITAAVIINIVAIARRKYANQLGFLALVPLAFLLLTGLYLFLLPYSTKCPAGGAPAELVAAALSNAAFRRYPAFWPAVASAWGRQDFRSDSVE